MRWKHLFYTARISVGISHMDVLPNQHHDSIKGSEPAWMPFVVNDVLSCVGLQVAC